MRVAIIDNGIFESQMLFPMKIKHYSVREGKIKEQNQKLEGDHASHGTVCARIISSIASDFELIDINIFDSYNASVEDLSVALDWCYDNFVSVINMSFGTINYLDFGKLESHIERLIDKGVFLVAAHNNLFIKSYPAIHKNVFGVRLDKSESLVDGEFGYQLSDGLNFENCFVAHYDINHIEDGNPKTGNSYAAPVIVGHIINFLAQQLQATFDMVLKYLASKCNQQCVSIDIRTTISDLVDSTDIPVIGFYDRNQLLFRSVKERLCAEKYEVISFIDFDNEQLGIPLEFYCPSGKGLTQDLISTLGLIYVADVFLLCLNKKKYCESIINKLVDLIIVEENGWYQINSQNGIYYCKSEDEIYQYIINYFS